MSHWLSTLVHMCGRAVCEPDTRALPTEGKRPPTEGKQEPIDVARRGRLTPSARSVRLRAHLTETPLEEPTLRIVGHERERGPIARLRSRPGAEAAQKICARAV